MRARTCLLWLAIVLLTALPLRLVSVPPAAPGAQAAAIFAGADDRAQRAIGDIAPGYKPWFAPLLVPASPEIASLLFALQAAAGAGVIGFWLGMSVARERARRLVPAAATPAGVASTDTHAPSAGIPARTATPPLTTAAHGMAPSSRPSRDHRAD